MTWLLVTGGRDYTLGEGDLRWLHQLDRQYEFTGLIHGGAKGVDRAAARWFLGRRQGMRRPTAIMQVTPAWTGEAGQLRREAGPERNALMVRLAQEVSSERPVCAVFPGGRGTASCMRLAYSAGLLVLESPSRERARIERPRQGPGPS